MHKKEERRGRRKRKKMKEENERNAKKYRRKIEEKAMKWGMTIKKIKKRKTGRRLEVK